MASCSQCAAKFKILDSDRAFYTTINVPEPSLCPDCRRQQRLAHWPFGMLQKRTCDFSGESIISTFPPQARFPVYKREYWFSDKWTPPEQEIDWDCSFFDQLYELQCKTPHFHQLGKNNQNCDYADDVYFSKNAYMSRSMVHCEDVYYVYRLIRSKDSLDLTYCFDMNECYECTYCFESYNLYFSLHCRQCRDSYFLYDCHNTRDSFMCSNLRNKQYHIFNKPYSKEEYSSKLKTFQLNSRKFLENQKVKFQKYLQTEAFHRAHFRIQAQNCTGNHITKCKNCSETYFLEESEDCAYFQRGLQSKNCQDVSGLLTCELCYQACQSVDLNNVNFANYCMDCHDSEYIDQCYSSENLFGCVGLKRQRCCILNKQYSEEDYKKLVPKIIEHMKQYGEYGEFFPYRFAYNGFNLSLGAFYYNTETQESVRSKGGFWEEIPQNDEKGISGKELPDTTQEITDEYLKEIIACAQTGKIYNFIKPELDFYRQHNLPLPQYYPEERNLQRFRQLMTFTPREVSCHLCKTQTVTYYPEYLKYQKILCEKCYVKTVV